jgi:hypothetical protein
MVKSGKFENVAIAVRTITNAEAVFLIVLNGSDGSGFSVQAESGLNELLPAVLRRVAQEIFGQDQVTDS